MPGPVVDAPRARASPVGARPAPRPACPAAVWTSALPTRLATTWRRRSSSPSDDDAASVDVAGDRPVGLDGPRVAHRVVGQSTPRSTGAALERPALVEPGEQQQVLDERAHAHRLLLGAAHGLAELVGVGEAARAVQLGVAPDGGDRRAQLVGRVGDEPAQPLLGPRALVEGLLDAPEHLVERRCRARPPRCPAPRRAPGGDRSPPAMRRRRRGHAASSDARRGGAPSR